MGMPRVVRLMTQRVRIHRVGHIDIGDMDGHAQGDQAWGVYEGSGPFIVMASGQGGERERHTFLHENLHMMLDLGGLTKMFDDDATEEKFTGRLAPVMLAWLRENPSAVKYLLEHE
jgi:hypothetical protein